MVPATHLRVDNSNVDMSEIPHSQPEKPRANGFAKPPLAPLTSRSLPEVCDELRRKVIAFLGEKTENAMLRNVQSQVRVSMGVIDEALSRYEPEQLSLSYNGGKDCLVLLVLLLACLPKLKTSSSRPTTNADAFSPNPTPIDRKATDSKTPQTSRSEPNTSAQRFFPQTFQAVYIVPPDPFPEVEDFVATTARQYHLDLARYVMPMKAALEEYLDERKAVRAVFVGTRRTDPHGEFLTHFDPTDDGWPQVMRVHPVIDWHYTEVWAFIRHLDIPFCELYSQGYTSLGGISNTRPNPALALDKTLTRFRPAYELVDDDQERLGRDS